MNLVEEIEKDRIVGPSTIYQYAVTGEEYQEFHLRPFHRRQEAEEALITAFNLYARDKGKYLYWRLKPEITEQTSPIKGWAGSWWRAYMRVLCTDRAPS